MTDVADILSLARELALPEPVLIPLERSARALPVLPVRSLASPDTAGETWKAIVPRIPDWKEDGGMSQLAVTLAAALHTRETYRACHISDKIYLSTMDCLRRFLEETYAMLNRWTFDRGFWTWRQTGCLLFRLGALEFEYCAPGAGERRPESLRSVPVLNVHIPSDAALAREELERSYDWARRFFTDEAATLCRQGQPQAVLCGSWLLSPALEELLPEDSAIRRFAKDYRRYAVDEEDAEFYRWLFGSPTPLPAADLPEHTSLQRRAKARLASGGRIGMACGRYAP